LLQCSLSGFGLGDLFVLIGAGMLALVVMRYLRMEAVSHHDFVSL
jgi:1,4-dihydroxy-2-naphthoate octaprenyltransferase